MKKPYRLRAGLALALAVILLLSGCGTAFGAGAADAAQTAAASETDIVQTPAVSGEESPAPDDTAAAAAPADSPESEVTKVVGENVPEEHIVARTVDELIAAIGSDRVVQLPDGEFKLTDARSYGGDTGSEFVRWRDCGDGYELVLENVENLYLVGHGQGNTRIVTEPRYANVLHFAWCENVNLVSLTAGHTPAPGYCAGGVLYFENADGMNVTDCDLYGCGTLGIEAVSCRRVTATDTVIRECSYGAVEARSCFDVRFVGGKIIDCGVKNDFSAFDLFLAQATTGFAVFNTEIHGNKAQTLLHSVNSPEVQMRGCNVRYNMIASPAEQITREDGSTYTWTNGGLFHIIGRSPVVAGCAFTSNTVGGSCMYFSNDGERAGTVVDDEGTALTFEDLKAMQRTEFLGPYDGPSQEEAPASAAVELDETGLKVFHVDNVDDFLAAVGSDTVIYVDTELLDFSQASGYGGYGGGSSYSWQTEYDGPNLVITGVRNFHIIGLGRDKTTLQAVPRYADVLHFECCSNISVENLTAGHLREAPGSCAGDVLEFNNCGEITVRGCGLFGCGVNGVMAYCCQNVTVADTEIYECSNMGAQFISCSGVSFEDCAVRDCNYNGIYLSSCRDVSWDGLALGEGRNDLA